MDDTLHDRVAGWDEAAHDVADDSRAARDRQGTRPGTAFDHVGILRVEGQCIACRRKTTAIVIFDGKAAFLCPPCGWKFREPA